MGLEEADGGYTNPPATAAPAAPAYYYTDDPWVGNGRAPSWLDFFSNLALL